MVLQRAAGRAELRRHHPIVGRLTSQAEELGAPLHVHAARTQGAPQHLLDGGLTHEGQVREGGVGKVDVAEPHRQHPTAEVDACLRRGIRPVEERVGDAERTKALERSGMEHHRSRRLDAVLASIHDSDACAMRVRCQGGGQSRRTGADDQDIGLGRHVTETRRHHASSDTAVVDMRFGSARTSSRCSPGRTW